MAEEFYVKVYLFRKNRVPPIEIARNSQLKITIETMDYTIPEGATASAFAKGAFSVKIYTQKCTVDGNRVSFTPEPGFFVKGRNILQYEIGDSVIPLAIDVNCEICLPDGGEAVEPETVKPYVLRAEEAAKKSEEAADRAQEVKDSIPEDYTELAEDVNQLKDDIVYQDEITKTINNLSVVQGYVDSSGNILKGGYAGFFVTDYIEIPLNSWKASYNAITNGNYIAFYDKDKVYISKSDNPAMHEERRHDAYIPSNAKYIVLSTYVTDKPTDLYVTFYKGGAIGDLNRAVNPFEKIDLVSGYVQSNDGVVINSNIQGYKSTRYIPIPKDCKFVYHNFMYGGITGWGLYDKDFVCLNSGKDMPIISNIPRDAAYIVLSDYKKNDDHDGLYLQFVTSELYGIIEEKSKYDAMRKKKIVLMGDSITDLNVSGKWVELLKKKVYGLNITDYARGSATWTFYNDTVYDLSSDNVGNHNNVIWNQYNRMKKDIDDGVIDAPDYIFICGGMNDVLQGKTVGDVETTFSGTILDKDIQSLTTLAQSIRYVIQKLRNDYPNVTIIIATPYASINYIKRAKQYGDIIKSCALYLGCTVIDWFGELGFCPWSEELRFHFLNSDGVHPSSIGDKVLCDFMALKMSQIIRD